MSEWPQLILLLVLAGLAVTVLGSAAIWLMDEERRIRRELKRVLKDAPEAMIVAPGRGRGLANHGGHILLEDPRLFVGDLLDRVAQVLRVLEVNVGDRRGDGGDDVRLHVRPRALGRQCLGEPDEAHLRRRVVRLPEVPEEPGRRRGA